MNGNRPVAAVFARDVNDGLTSLVKKIDEATAKNSDARMASWVVFCNDDEGLEKKLKDFIDKEKIKKTVLAIGDNAGPEDYNIAKDADVTVLLYVKKTVKVNYSFKKGQMTDKDVDKILADLSKILPDK
jgi:hypothetical protein